MRNSKRLMRGLAWLANLVLLLSLAYLLMGCKSLETRCLERFPTETRTEVRQRTVIDTVLLPDTYVEFVDTTYCPPELADTLVVIKPITRYLKGDTIYREVVCTDTVTVVEHDERVAYLLQENQRLETKLNEEKKRYPLLSGIAHILTLLIVLAGAYLVARVLGFFT